jgi:hypothetical protein
MVVSGTPSFDAVFVTRMASSRTVSINSVASAKVPVFVTLTVASVAETLFDVARSFAF